jgi:hypothetical protein
MIVFGFEVGTLVAAIDGLEGLSTVGHPAIDLQLQAGFPEAKQRHTESPKISTGVQPQCSGQLLVRELHRRLDRESRVVDADLHKLQAKPCGEKEPYTRNTLNTYTLLTWPVDRAEN